MYLIAYVFARLLVETVKAASCHAHVDVAAKRRAQQVRAKLGSFDNDLQQSAPFSLHVSGWLNVCSNTWLHFL